jgi:hypothetical protein
MHFHKRYQQGNPDQWCNGDWNCADQLCTSSWPWSFPLSGNCYCKSCQLTIKSLWEIYFTEVFLTLRFFFWILGTER